MIDRISYNLSKENLCDFIDISYKISQADNNTNRGLPVILRFSKNQS